MSTERKAIREELTLPQGVTAAVATEGFVIKGKLGEVKRKLENPNVEISVQGDKLQFLAKSGRRADKMALMTALAHAKNMVRGVSSGHQYKLKICSGHFPMNVVVSGNELVIKNFLGEKFPRKMPIAKGVSVKIAGQEVLVESPDKEAAGTTASDIEQLTKIANRDRRVFQDGIYITLKDGVELQ